MREEGSDGTRAAEAVSWFYIHARQVAVKEDPPRNLLDEGNWYYGCFGGSNARSLETKSGILQGGKSNQA